MPTLTGFASLPALTFVPGSEPSGAALGTAPVNGIAAPWDGQPVQGFSGVLPILAGSPAPRQSPAILELWWGI